MPNIEQRLQEGGIVLPEPIPPVGNYSPAVRWGQLLFVSGHVCRRDGKPVVGRLGDNVNHEQGYELARLTALDLLSTVRKSIGTLDGVSQILKLTGMVKSTPTFVQQSAVLNGASDFLAVLWGEKGVHARSSFGVPELPLGAALEIDMICAIAEGY